MATTRTGFVPSASNMPNSRRRSKVDIIGDWAIERGGFFNQA